jgi:tRNA (guanine37-N1)-methyltransferase
VSGPPALRVTVLTAFPSWLERPMAEGVLGRARAAGTLDLRVRDLRAYAHDRHRSLDDEPFGVGVGMLLMAPPVLEALDDAAPRGTALRILLAPDGEPFDQALAHEFARVRHLVLLAGRYEGVDERVRRHVDRVVSLGDFVLMGGEAAAWAIVEAVARLVPGVVEARSLVEESFDDGLLEAPQYTRPARLEWAGEAVEVPSVLRSGNHAAQARARRRAALARTLLRRPDLLTAYRPRPGDSALWGEILVAAATWAGGGADWADRMVY